MLIGEYKHKIDEKNRISLPMKFRKSLGKNIVITRGLDNCLFIYTEKEWIKMSDSLSDLGMGQAERRKISRYFMSEAAELKIDSVGRILIPERLKSIASIKDNVVFAGLNNRVEVWNEKDWESYKKQSLKDVETIAEKLGDIGAI